MKEVTGIIAQKRTLDRSLDGSLLRRRDGEGRRDGLEGSEAGQHVEEDTDGESALHARTCRERKKREKV